MIKSLIIQNFKIFDSFQLVLNGSLNTIVGNNDAGKSTILEAISLALTKRIGAKPIEYDLSPYLFNKACVDLYLKNTRDGKNPALPKILIEEPENHLSFSSMNKLISKIEEKCFGKQIIIATHSAYVLNKLGIEKVHLLHANKTTSLIKLPIETQNYFKKLSGYDTLRLILAKKAILVEGPSDELILQKMYKIKHGKLPIENGVDVINVRGLSFKRFLDIAKELGNEVVVVTDNDGDYQKKVKKKYEEYEKIPTIKICADNDDNAETLESQLAKCNDLQLLNRIFATPYLDKNSLVDYMKNNKTECALKIFDSSETVKAPYYLANAIN